ncbi:MAG: CDP-glycerol glycerophosphotransferase family protein, partial [Clostridia bacterium]|nr:CDP-glycerol glycerophosphotransferase family protein [Clostridia bacterium]
MIRWFLMMAFRVGLTLCYLPMRLLPARNKVVFLSRQNNKPSLDFRLLSEQIKTVAHTVEQVILCRKIPSSFIGKIGYGFHLFTQMFHLATARAAVLDGYCISACLLPHKKSLKIFQIWHALGLMKKFGYAALDSKEGSSSTTARIMRMHKGYHKIVCSSPHLIEDIACCYQASPRQMLPCGLPRMDYLRSEEWQRPHREQ